MFTGLKESDPNASELVLSVRRRRLQLRGELTNPHALHMRCKDLI